MRTHRFVMLALSLAAGANAAQPVPQRYHVVHGWPRLPDNEMLDEVSGVAVDRAGNVLVLMRAGRKWPDTGDLDTSPIAKPTIFLFAGKTGRLLRRFGAGLFAMPHNITVDRENNIWVADVALHQVFKLAPSGRLLLALGTRATPGQDAAHFNQPSDVAVARDGSIFVSDGYRNSRVVKFDSSGKFLLTWGTKGKAAGQLDVPHAIAIDRRGRVCVDDRANARIQCFDPAGQWLFTWNGPPFVSPQDLKFDTSGRAYIVEAGNADPPDKSGVLVLDGRGHVQERIGRFGNYDGQFFDPHWVAVDANGAVYVADFAGRRVQKFVR
jgi:peptidylamidoglycolate lyase